MAWLSVSLSRRGEAHPAKSQFKIKAPLKISNRVWPEFKWCTECSRPRRHHLPQCNLTPSTAAQHFPRGFWKAKPSRTDMHQPEHSEEKDMLHLNTTPREPLWKFCFSSWSFWNHIITEHYEFSLRKRQIKFLDFPVMEKSRESVRETLKPIPTVQFKITYSINFEALHNSKLGEGGVYCLHICMCIYI